MAATALDSLALRARAEQIANVYLAQPPHAGAPSTLGDPDKVQLFLSAIADGNYRETACKVAGIAKQTLYGWLKRAEAGDEAAIRFADALEKAEGDAEAETVRNVRNASRLPQFWAAGMTYLERKSPDRWGRRQDDNSAPRVVVQIGAQTADVKVLITGSETGLSPVPFASDEGRRPDANLLTGNTYALPSCPISSVMVTSPEIVPAVAGVTDQPVAGARFAGAGRQKDGAPLRAEGRSVKARLRGPAAKDAKHRRRRRKEKSPEGIG